MKNYKPILAYLLLVLLGLFSCSDNDPETTCDAVGINISVSEFMEAATSALSLSNINLEGDCLTMDIGFSGCSDNHEFKMVSDGAIAESLPVQMQFRILDTQPEACQAFFVVSYTFDLSSLEIITEEEVVTVHLGRFSFNWNRQR